MSNSVRYVLGLIALSAALALGYYGVVGLALKKTLVTAVWVGIAYFFVLTLAAHFLVMRISKENPKTFVTAFAGAIGFKMLISLFILLIYLALHFAHPLNFGLSFLVCYLVFTAWEVIVLFRSFRKQKA